jgi:hypothetical protein
MIGRLVSSSSIANDDGLDMLTNFTYYWKNAFARSMDDRTVGGHRLR